MLGDRGALVTRLMMFWNIPHVIEVGHVIGDETSQNYVKQVASWFQIILVYLWVVNN